MDCLQPSSHTIAPFILSIAYAAPIQYWSYLFHYPCLIEQHENFHKQTYRNRCLIASPQGIMPLTIPVVSGAATQCPIREVRIAEHDDWQHKHWQALCTSYGNTPFFEYYAPDLQHFYQKPLVCDRLFDFLINYTQTLMGLLHLDRTLQLTDYYHSPEEPNNKTQKIRPKNPDPDPRFASQAYYQSTSNGKQFFPNLSILDLLFNMGPESLIVLKQSLQVEDSLSLLPG